MVIIYTSPGCASCRKAKQWLKENNIEFVEKKYFYFFIKMRMKSSIFFLVVKMVRKILFLCVRKLLRP